MKSLVVLPFREAIAVPFVLLLAGCQHAAAPKPQMPKPTPDRAYARFVPYPQAAALALDTKTGVLCHTFVKSADDAAEDKTLVPGQPKLDKIPLCIDLSQNEDETIKSTLFMNSVERTMKKIRSQQ